MLQRIQTLYWLGAIILNIWLGISLQEIQSKSFFSLMYFVLAFDLLVIILLFKKRPLQLKLNQFTLYIHLFCLIILTFNYGQKFSLCIWAGFPIILITLAGRAVKKDEELVRSADRLR